jgi:DNA-binding FrmR family transcriptional regulator
MSTNQKANLLRRLKRVEGQVRGIGRMVDEEQTCTDILMQVAAAKAALHQVGVLILENHAEACMARALEEGDPQEAAREIAKVLKKFLG